MKNLKFFETKAKALKEQSIDYRLVSMADLILSLMKQYRKDNNIGWTEYKAVYDKYFAKYHA